MKAALPFMIAVIFSVSQVDAVTVTWSQQDVEAAARWLSGLDSSPPGPSNPDFYSTFEGTPGNGPSSTGRMSILATSGSIKVFGIGAPPDRLQVMAFSRDGLRVEIPFEADSDDLLAGLDSTGDPSYYRFSASFTITEGTDFAIRSAAGREALVLRTTKDGSTDTIPMRYQRIPEPSATAFLTLATTFFLLQRKTLRRTPKIGSGDSPAPIRC